ncbi:hypothetical protein AB0H18_22480, partial [Streptomyces sp. NPDC020766]|uniref:hypothetical protein n=1 Tax=Streptomyces sp. NPDC020766 TaxID=3155011 RepID=UPI0033FF3923
MTGFSRPTAQPPNRPTAPARRPDRRGGGEGRALELWHAAPGCVRSAEAFSQSERWEALDEDA